MPSGGQQLHRESEKLDTRTTHRNDMRPSARLLASELDRVQCLRVRPLHRNCLPRNSCHRRNRHMGVKASVGFAPPFVKFLLTCAPPLAQSRRDRSAVGEALPTHAMAPLLLCASSELIEAVGWPFGSPIHDGGHMFCGFFLIAFTIKRLEARGLTSE